MIVCQQLVKVYGTGRRHVRALDGLDLEVKPGEMVCIRGPSGCGKSTLLLTLGGMLRPTAGRVLVAGDDLYARDSSWRAGFRARQLGFVFQMFHLLPYLTVRENVQLAAQAPLSKAEVESLLEKLGLAARADHRPEDLSAGERQRTALARALINRPPIILADEPTGNLDPENAAEVFHHLGDYQRSGGTVIVVTHSSVAESYATRVCQMRTGRITPPVP
jgi:ABC-type lipoprotein export system ATPase subunit